jgi:hypothetical protein
LLAWFKEPLGIPIDILHEGAALLGALMGTVAAAGLCHHGLLFAAMWFLYLGLYGVGQTFYSFQWDILLLEAGFATILYAPWSLAGSLAQAPSASTVWPLRWLLFKLMFMSGMVKVQALCPSWLQLTALEYHFATQVCFDPPSSTCLDCVP